MDPVVGLAGTLPAFIYRSVYEESPMIQTNLEKVRRSKSILTRGGGPRRRGTGVAVSARRSRLELRTPHCHGQMTTVIANK